MDDRQAALAPQGQQRRRTPDGGRSRPSRSAIASPPSARPLIARLRPQASRGPRSSRGGTAIRPSIAPRRKIETRTLRPRRRPAAGAASARRSRKRGPPPRERSAKAPSEEDSAVPHGSTPVSDCWNSGDARSQLDGVLGATSAASAAVGRASPARRGPPGVGLAPVLELRQLGDHRLEPPRRSADRAPAAAGQVGSGAPRPATRGSRSPAEPPARSTWTPRPRRGRARRPKLMRCEQRAGVEPRSGRSG